MNIKYGLIALYMASSGFGYSQNIGINATGIAPDGSATLDVNSTAGGMLIPRMTTIQRDAINGGTFANALLLFNTTDNCLQIRNTTSNQWENVYCFSSCSGAPSQLKIYNVLGHDVTALAKQISGSDSKLIIDLSSLNAGMYYIKTKTTANKVYKQ
ncbi:T9SS type A sorting domain-containing protein [Flavobacteriales bacterium]|nr:T9SS type A sorting domain-containing protein [Flavobacteriales bacterium]